MNPGKFPKNQIYSLQILTTPEEPLVKIVYQNLKYGPHMNFEIKKQCILYMYLVKSLLINNSMLQ